MRGERVRRSGGFEEGGEGMYWGSIEGVVELGGYEFRIILFFSRCGNWLNDLSFGFFLGLFYCIILGVLV